MREKYLVRWLSKDGRHTCESEYDREEDALFVVAARQRRGEDVDWEVVRSTDWSLVAAIICGILSGLLVLWGLYLSRSLA